MCPEEYDESLASAGDDDDGPLPFWLLHDECIAGVIGAWEQHERSREAAQLLLRVHRAEMALRNKTWGKPGHLIFPPHGGLVLWAQRQGWLD